MDVPMASTFEQRQVEQRWRRFMQQQLEGIRADELEPDDEAE